MILSAQAIQQAQLEGRIDIDPFDVSNLNPNSYNFRLGSTILKCCMNAPAGHAFERIDLPPDGFVLAPKTLYLAATLEIIGSTEYAITLLGRSSLGRLGLFLNITADLGHVGTLSQWTLELSVVQPLRVYPGMRIGQVAFWKAYGTTRRYCGRYHQDLGPIPSKDNFEKVESGVLS